MSLDFLSIKAPQKIEAWVRPPPLFFGNARILRYPGHEPPPFVSTIAPFDSNKDTVLAWPLRAARFKAVFPS